MAAASTFIAAAAIAGLGYKTYKDGKRATEAAPEPLVIPVLPKWEMPKVGEAVKRQRTRTTGASGRAGTIRTGPSGLNATPASKPKTLLGE